MAASVGSGNSISYGTTTVHLYQQIFLIQPVDTYNTFCCNHSDLV